MFSARRVWRYAAEHRGVGRDMPVGLLLVIRRMHMQDLKFIDGASVTNEQLNDSSRSTRLIESDEHTPAICTDIL